MKRMNNLDLPDQSSQAGCSQTSLSSPSDFQLLLGHYPCTRSECKSNAEKIKYTLKLHFIYSQRLVAILIQMHSVAL